MDWLTDWKIPIGKSAKRAFDWLQEVGEPLFDWALLKHFDADLRLSAADIEASSLELGSGGLTITAKNGAISSEVGELDLCGGQMAGRVGLDLSGPRIKASFAGNLSDVAIETLELAHEGVERAE